MRIKPVAAVLVALPFVVSMLAADTSAAAPSVARTNTISSVIVVSRFSKFESSFTLPNQTGNPYDPSDNDVVVRMTGPDGLNVHIPAFWDGDRWRVRYAPAHVGNYLLVVIRNGRTMDAVDLTHERFRCVAARDDGFVRVSRRETQKFVFDSARPYYPIGINVAWKNGGDPDYNVYFAKMRKAHLNWARVWSTAWDGKNLEWSPDKTKSPARGSFLMAAAKRWDEIFDLAAQSGVYVQMVLQHHGQYTEKTDPNWADNPFNVANGGFLKKPDDFFTDAEARRLTKAKYRYIVARWGYSDHLLAFELFNEVQNIGEANTHFADVINWHKEMAAYLRSIDVNHHLITTSYSDPGNPLSRIGLDYDQIHAYPPDVVSTFAALRTQGLKTPVFFGEWGPPDAKPDELPQLVHDGLWAGLMIPTAGAQQYWYWDRVESRNMWPLFASVGAFVQEFGVPSLAAMDPIDVQVDSPGPKGDLSFAPPGGWEATTKSDVTLLPESVPDLSGISSYIQGQGHRDMTSKPIVFHVNGPAPFRFQVFVGALSKGGAHPTLTLDASPPASLDFPASDKDRDADQTLGVDVPAGPHTVSLFNTGADWFVVKRIVATGYAPSVAVMAKGNAHSSLFWAYDRDRAARTPRTATLHFSGLAPGSYRVRLWDVARAAPGGAFAARAQKGGALTVALPAFTGDVAGIVTPTGNPRSRQKP